MVIVVLELDLFIVVVQYVSGLYRQTCKPYTDLSREFKWHLLLNFRS